MPKIIINNDGKSGDLVGGDFGSNGLPGTDAKPISVSLKIDSAAHKVVIKDNLDGSLKDIPQEECEKSSIQLSAQGGKGGDGWPGMPGMPGIDGWPGTDAYYDMFGTNGGNGSSGMDGSNGGDGAPGGKGADIDVYVEPDNLELLMLLESVNIAGGFGGLGGAGGPGGIGGKGGKGGESLYWTTYENVPRPFGGPGEYERVENRRYTPGGYDGMPGFSGKDGMRGMDGASGKAGAYRIHIGGQTYSGPYNLRTERFAPISSDDGIIEPGEMLSLEALTFQNSGPIPTPEGLGVEVSIDEGPWIQPCGPSALIPASIKAGDSYTLTEPLKFVIKNNFKLIPNKVPIASVKLKWHAKLQKINKLFPEVEAACQTLEVGYPVVLSSIKGPSGIMLYEEAPFVFQIKNVSNKDIGKEAAEPRVLQLKLSTNSSYSSKIQVKFSKNATDYSLERAVIWRVPHLAAKWKRMFSGTLRFLSDLPDLTTVPVSLKLMLASKEDPSNLITIQESTFSLKLNQNYRPNPMVGFVLATHSGNTPEQIDSWQKVSISLFGAPMPVWDVTSNLGIDYFYKRKDGSSFAEELKGKVLVILNDSYSVNHQVKRIVSDELSPAEIYRAAKEANISTYVVGSDVNFDYYKLNIVDRLSTAAPVATARTPLLSAAPTGSEVISIYTYRPDRNHLAFQEKINELKARITRESPLAQMLIISDYNPRKIGSGCIYEKWQLGSIGVIPGLSLVCAKIVIRAKKGWNFSADDNDAYNMIKLLPFESKLNCLQNATGYKEQVIQALLSDLAEEQVVWRRSDLSESYPKEVLKAKLRFLMVLSRFDFTTMAADRGKTGPVLSFLMLFEKLIGLFPNDTGCCLFSQRVAKVTAISLEAISLVLQSYFPHISAIELNVIRTKVHEYWRMKMQGSRLQEFRTPRDYKSSKYIGVSNDPVMVLDRDSFIKQPTKTKDIESSTLFFFGPGAEERREAAFAHFAKELT